jgi:hypothetical protein
VRDKAVAATPEEHVRLQVIEELKALGYPLHLMQSEVRLPDREGRRAPRRRLDLVCYAPTNEGVRPLLLVECKAHRIDLKTLAQAVGYNYFVCAPLIALACVGKLVCYSAHDLETPRSLPTYAQALACLQTT